MRGEKETDLFVDTTGTTLEKGQVHGQSADLLISHDPDVASAILWTGPQNNAFYILIKIILEENFIFPKENV